MKSKEDDREIRQAAKAPVANTDATPEELLPAKWLREMPDKPRFTLTRFQLEKLVAMANQTHIGGGLMQLKGATELEKRLYDTCIAAETGLGCGELQTRVITVMSDASAELQHQREKNEVLNALAVGHLLKKIKLEDAMKAISRWCDRSDGTSDSQCLHEIESICSETLSEM